MLLGIVPLLTLMLINAQLMYGSGLNIFGFYAVIITLIVLGILLIYVYQVGSSKSGSPLIVHGIAGIAGIKAIMIGYFILISTGVLAATPEVWPLFRTPVPLVFSVKVVARYVLFINILFGFTGLGILYYFLKWEKNSAVTDDVTVLNLSTHIIFIRKFGAGLALAAIAGMPIPILWTLVTSPAYTLSGSVITFYVLAILFCLPLVLILVKYLQTMERKITHTPLVFLVIVLLLVLVNDQLSQSNAVIESRNVIKAEALKIRSELEEKRGVHGGGEATFTKGEKVFKARCTLCHEFDKRVVGPPYNLTVPEYEGHIENLADYIKHPVRKDPDYPPMPSLGLKSVEAKSVAIYLIESIKNATE